MSKVLKKLRISKNIKGEELAELLGITKASYSKKENGLVKFTLNEAYKLAEFFGMSIEELFFEHNVSNIETIYKELV